MTDAPLPPTTASDAELVAFLREAARYFDRLPINGEDNAHWANMYNAKNCRKAADRLDKLSAEVAAKDVELSEWFVEEAKFNASQGRPSFSEYTAKLAAAEAEAAGLRSILRQAKAFHDRDSGLNGFTADYEILRRDIDAALSPRMEAET